MIIDLNSIDRENFMVKEGEVFGQKAFLVNPNHVGTKFTQKTSIFRSSIWSEDGELLDAGLKKFRNYGEDPKNFPDPKSLVGTRASLKWDGSTFLITQKNGILNCRTRGSFGISHLLNHYELQILQERYPFAFDNPILDREDATFVFEWVSPENVIVIKYPEPDMALLTIIQHSNYSYYTQDECDDVARDYGLKRPESFKFDSIEDVVNSVKDWRGKEGVCLYHTGDQHITKIKADHYKFLHSLKSELNTQEKLIDLFLSSGALSYSEFFDHIANNIDYEVAEHFRGNISKICDAKKEVDKIVDGMVSFVGKLKGMTRKEQALKILGAYGETNRASFVFMILDGKELDNDNLKKLYFQVMK